MYVVRVIERSCGCIKSLPHVVDGAATGIYAHGASILFTEVSGIRGVQWSVLRHRLGGCLARYGNFFHACAFCAAAMKAVQGGVHNAKAYYR